MLSLGENGGKLITYYLIIYEIETTQNKWGWDAVEFVAVRPNAQQGGKRGERYDLIFDMM